MIRLALAELRQDPRLWIGPLLVAVVTAGFVYLAAVYWWTLGTPVGSALIEGYGSTVAEARTGSYVVYVSSAVPAIAVLGTTSATTVAALSARIARWRLAGAMPGQVRSVVTIQVLIVNSFGAILGILIATPFCQAAVDLLIRMSTRADHTIPVDSTIAAGALAFLGSTLVCYLASFVPARRASRVPAVNAIRDTAEPKRTMPLSRWVVAGLLSFALLQQLVITIGVTLTLGIDDAIESGAATLAMMTGILALATISAFAPLLLPLILRLWTRIVPSRVAPAWFLARHTAITHPRETASAIMPIAVGIGLYGIMFGIIATWQQALTDAGVTEALNSVDTYVILTPAAVITATGSVASVLLSTRRRAREYAMTRVAGASPRTIIATAIAEAISYSVTAATIALLVTAAAVTTAAAALSSGELHAQPVIDLRQLLLLSGVGTVGLLLVLLVPAVSAIRGNPRDTISAT